MRRIKIFFSSFWISNIVQVLKFCRRIELFEEMLKNESIGSSKNY